MAETPLEDLLRGDSEPEGCLVQLGGFAIVVVILMLVIGLCGYLGEKYGYLEPANKPANAVSAPR